MENHPKPPNIQAPSRGKLSFPLSFLWFWSFSGLRKDPSEPLAREKRSEKFEAAGGSGASPLAWRRCLLKRGKARSSGSFNTSSALDGNLDPGAFFFSPPPFSIEGWRFMLTP